MKYLYKQTEIVVESDVALDSTMFQLVEEESEAKEEPEKKPVKKTAATGRKTSTAKSR